MISCIVFYHSTNSRFDPHKISLAHHRRRRRRCSQSLKKFEGKLIIWINFSILSLFRTRGIVKLIKENYIRQSFFKNKNKSFKNFKQFKVDEEKLRNCRRQICYGGGGVENEYQKSMTFRWEINSMIFCLCHSSEQFIEICISYFTFLIP